MWQLPRLAGRRLHTHTHTHTRAQETLQQAEGDVQALAADRDLARVRGLWIVWAELSFCARD